MTVHQSRRVVLVLVTLLVTNITIGAPIPLAASPLQRPIAKHVTRPDARFDGTHSAIAPRSPAAQSGDHGDDPFASLHFE
jgi:hypothetical protein